MQIPTRKVKSFQKKRIGVQESKQEDTKVVAPFRNNGQVYTFIPHKFLG